MASVLGATCAVEVVHSAEAALERIAASRPFDVIISDYGLPGLDGLALIERIRANGDHRIAETPIVMMSGHVDPELDAHAKRAGANRFLDKPFTLVQLRGTVRSLIDPKTICGRM